MAQYPNSANIDWTDSTVAGQGDELVDQQDVNFAEHVNEIRGEVKAIAVELGANPRGVQASVRARLESIESTKSGTGHLHDSAYIRRDVLASKGNVLTATAAGTPAVLAPGANGSVLMFDSAQSTGLRAKALDHGDDLAGKGDDDHPQYLNNARHDARDHSNVAGVPPYPFVGMVVDSARSDVPPLWLECNGQAVSRVTYADLFAAIDTTFGAGDGSTTFNLPDQRGKMRVGMDSTRTAYNAVGKTGGAETVALTTAQLPSHSHTTPSHTHTTPNHSHTAGSLATSHTGGHSHKVYDDSSFNTGWSSKRGVTASSVSMSGTWNALRVSTDSDGSHSHSMSGSTGTASPSTNGASPTTNSTGSGSAHENMSPFGVFKTLIFAGV